jgi:hypothetical protein
MDIPLANDASYWPAANPFASWKINLTVSHFHFNQLESSYRRRHLYHLYEASHHNPLDREHPARGSLRN